MGAVSRAVSHAGRPLNGAFHAVSVWAGAYAAVSLAASARALRRRSDVISGPRASASILVLRPVAGDDGTLAASLAQTSDLAPGEARFRVAVADDHDAAAPIAEAAATTLRAAGHDATRVLTGPTDAPNRKAAQLARALAVEANGAEIIVVADADVDLASLSLRQIVSMLNEVSVPIVWVPTIESGGETLADRASAAVLGGSLHAFPLLATLDAHGLVGKLFAIRADALAAVGGFRALEPFLGEDMELARRFSFEKKRVFAAPFVARSSARGRSGRAIVDRYTRWLTVIRWQRPLLLTSYPLLFAAAPILVIAALALGNVPALAATVIARLGVALVAAHVAGRGLSIVRAVVDAALADGLLLIAFGRVLGGAAVRWKGRVVERG